MDQGHLLTIGKFPWVYRHYYRQDFDFRKLHYKGESEDILMDIDKVECTRFKKERFGKYQSLGHANSDQLFVKSNQESNLHRCRREKSASTKFCIENKAKNQTTT